MRTLLDPDAVRRGLRRVAGEIVERHGGTKDLMLIGVRRGGIPVAQELLRWLRELEPGDIEFGTVDITLYRDDAATALPNPRIGPTEIPGGLDGKRVILVDDVAYTRRTTRAALDALLDYGRPRLIEFAVLIDRAGRELPIMPDYSVKRCEDIRADERVDVLSDPPGLRAVVQPMSAPSVPPPTSATS